MPPEDIEAFEGLPPPAKPGETIPHAWNDLTRRVIGAAMQVHTALGPGLPERFYERAMVSELRRAAIPFHQQRSVPIAYHDEPLGELRLDLVIDDLLVLELKATEKVADLHLLRLVTYLRAGDFPLGLLLNFNTPHLRDAIFRRIHTPALTRRLTR